MFGPPGMAYVYLVYGMYDCLNVVTEPERRPAAILVRAIEPLEGIERMREARISRLSRRRGMTPEASDRERARLASIAPARLASGPGLVAAAFSIDRSDTGVDLCAARSGLHLEPATAGHRPFEIVAGPRVGIDYAGEPWASKPWRLAIAASAAVSGPTIPA
jgi:DNA-3-methyladenine glycosylase